LNPGSVSVHQWYGWYLFSTKRADEALKEIRRAQELDPLSYVINTELGLPFFITRQYDRAIEQFKKGVEIDPNGTWARCCLAWSYIQKGMYEEAITAANKSDDPYLLVSTAHAYALLGKRAEAQKIIERLKKQARQRYVPSYIMARIYIGLGEKEHAIEWLEKSYEDREDSLIWLNSDPGLDGLRSEPRFQDLVRRVGLPQ
jgi:tetratricopeptide (TPR) repeat protein